MGELINGRTPEEIKTALKVCPEDMNDCPLCPYTLSFTCRDGVMSDALALIQHLESERDAALAKVPKWISVKERLPEAFQCVIVHVRHTKKWRDSESDPSKWWRVVEEDCWSGQNWCGNSDTDIHEVTHWMPLPELPEEE